MTTSQKAALSLLISIILFGAFAALAFTGLFDLIEARFYNPSVTASVTREISRNADTVDKYLEELQTRFSATLRDAAIRRSFLPNQSAEDIFERSRIYGLLAESLGGLQWIRFIDSGGSRLHFSTYEPDILRQDRLSVSYRNYDEPGFPYDTVAVRDNEIPKYIFDESQDRVLFSFPFYDSFDVYRGTALFSLSVKAVMDMLIQDGGIKVGQNLSVVSDPPGFLSGMAAGTEKALIPEAAAVWKQGGAKVARLVSPDSGFTLALISARTPRGFFVGRVVNEEIFSFPETMKTILLISFFLTVYLTAFLLFNLRQDSVTIVQNRLKQLQISLIEQYYERKEEVDWKRWSRELEQRREEIGTQLKRGIKASPGHKAEEVDTLIDKSWDELLSVMGGNKSSGIDEEKLQTILSRVLAALPASGGPIQIAPPPPSVPEAVEEFETVEDSGEFGLAETAETVEEFEAAEETEAPGETEHAGPVDEVEEIGESGYAETSGTVEEFESADGSGETEAPEETASLEEFGLEKESGEAETLEAVEEAEGPYETAYAETAGDLEKIETAPEALPPDEAETLEAVEEAEGPNETVYAETAGDLEEIETALEALLPDEIEFAEAVEETETAEEPEILEEIPVIDITEMNLSVAAADEAMQAAVLEGAVDELEELDEADSVEELEDLESGESAADSLGEMSGAPSEYSVQNIANLASQIEFSPEYEPETLEDTTPLHEDLEIVSPFSTMLSGFSTGDNPPSPDESAESFESDAESGDETLPEELSETVLDEEGSAGEGLFLVYKPFGNISDNTDLEILEALPGETGDSSGLVIEEIELAEADAIIEEREGVHYISGDAIKADPETEVTLDRDFKNLVDSIIK